MNSGLKSILASACMLVALLVACDDSSGGSSGSGGAGGDPSGGGGCGGGCPGPTDCAQSADCAADEYCAKENCLGTGTCEKRPEVCPEAPVEACGCDGTVYAGACAAAQAGESSYLSLTECSDAPAGQFPCGTGFCSLADEYCRGDLAGALACAAAPQACAGSPTCDCVLGQDTCAVCEFPAGSGVLATGCAP